MPDDLKELRDLNGECKNQRDGLLQYLESKKLSEGLQKEINQFVALTNDHLDNIWEQRGNAATIIGRSAADDNYKKTLLEFAYIIKHNKSFIETNVPPDSSDARETVANVLDGVLKTLHKSEDLAMHVNRLKPDHKRPQNPAYSLSH